MTLPQAFGKFVGVGWRHHKATYVFMSPCSSTDASRHRPYRQEIPLIRKKSCARPLSARRRSKTWVFSGFSSSLPGMGTKLSGTVRISAGAPCYLTAEAKMRNCGSAVSLGLGIPKKELETGFAGSNNILLGA